MSHERSRLEMAETFAKVALGIISLLGIAAMFFGFGFALALRRFGVDVHQVLHGPGDYLALSVYPVIELYAYLFRIAFDGDRIGLAWKVIAGTLSVVVPLYYIGRYVGRSKHFEDFREKGMTRGGPVLAKLKERLGFFWPPTLFGAIIAGGLLTIWPLLVIAVLSIVAIPTFLGLSYANDYLYENVENTTGCQKLATAQERRTEHQEAEKAKKEGRRPQRTAVANQDDDNEPRLPAMCLKIERKGERSLYGRRVIATSESIALFDPDSGVVDVVPTKDAVVSIVGSLPKEGTSDAKSSACAAPAQGAPRRKKASRPMHR